MGSEINENHRITNKDTIAMDLSASDKNGVIDELVNQLDKAKLSDIAQFKKQFIIVNHKVQQVLEKELLFLTQK